MSAPPAKPFITEWHDEDDIRAVTFGEFLRLAKLQAAEFLAQGLLAGDRIILIMPQGIPLMTAFAGAMMLGAVPAILAYPNFKADPDKYAAGLTGVTQNLKARLIVVDEEFRPNCLSVSQWLTARDSSPVLSPRFTPLNRHYLHCRWNLMGWHLFNIPQDNRLAKRRGAVAWRRINPTSPSGNGSESERSRSHI